MLSNPNVLGIHDLVVHDYGPGRVMISLHAEVPASGDMLHLHDAIDNIERDLNRDPVMNDDAQTQELKEKATVFLHELDASLNLHDFRIVKGPTHTNIIFDILVPFHFQYSDSEITSFMEEKIRGLDPSYYAVINLDRDYTT